MLIEAYDYFRQAVSFPHKPNPLTYFEYDFLCRAYPLFAEAQPTTVNDPRLSQALDQMQSFSGGGIS